MGRKSGKGTADSKRPLREGTFKARCADHGVDYWCALKRRQNGMPEEKIFSLENLRAVREVNPILVAGKTYPNMEAACRILNPIASPTTIMRWIAAGMSPEEAFDRMPNPGMAAGFIYLVRHLDSGVLYVGQTVQTIDRRWEYHQQQARQEGGVKNEGSLHQAIRVHGAGAFEIRPIDQGTSKINLGARERYWIMRLRTMVPDGFNILEGGESGGSSKVPTEVDSIPFPGRREAAEYISASRQISFQAAKKRLSNGRIDVPTPSRPGQSVVKTKAYKAWDHIIHGATKPGTKDYIEGIKVYEGWRKSQAFIADVGQPPHHNMAFVRLDKSKGFFPENCVWANKSEAASRAARSHLPPGDL
ncbi:GIY-YIG nuclease family protein [Falsihalocynthiibacter sp. S25ZX9]|uniref:GIY-YIG nuclease family protein n=1 Tax=Falsihalocynthiibacter sp. S25ZX9 TaxID=3240870 RepID=UPI00351062EA